MPSKAYRKPARSHSFLHSFLWITDPWDTLDHAKDTTLRLIEESLKLGYDNYWCDVHSIRLENHDVLVSAKKVKGIFPGRGEKAFRFEPQKELSPLAFSSLHYRVDPPIDLAYLHPLQLLQLAFRMEKKKARKKTKSKIINPPSYLALANEKTEAALLADLMPRTLVSSEWQRLEAFGRAEKKTVTKPLHQAQSKGVTLLEWPFDPSLEASKKPLEENKLQLATLTENFTRPVVLQQYLPGICEGEQRLWFVNSKLIAVARKIPKQGEFKIDMDAGARLAPSTLSETESKAARKISQRLKAARIQLAAVDLIEGLVTDFNFTSPGLIPAMESLLGENLAKKIIQALV